jgi:hypothetical protein
MGVRKHKKTIYENNRIQGDSLSHIQTPMFKDSLLKYPEWVMGLFFLVMGCVLFRSGGLYNKTSILLLSFTFIGVLILTFSLKPMTFNIKNWNANNKFFHSKFLMNDRFLAFIFFTFSCFLDFHPRILYAENIFLVKLIHILLKIEILAASCFFIFTLWPMIWNQKLVK